MTTPIDRSTDPLLQTLLDAGQEEDALPAGSKVGRYVVLEMLGAGGMSVVYKAYDPQLDRAVALKLMRTAPAGTDRVLREAQALARLAHPNVVAVHDAGTFDEKVFAAMEYVAGEPLGTWSKGRAPQEVLAAFRDAGRGLAAAHAAGLVHRDFKPDNAIVGRDGRVRVLDFGLAQSADGGDEAGTGDGPRDARVTRDGALAGTPAYMAPEQHLLRRADARSDQFSFCVALWEALWGRLPFAGDSVDTLRESVTKGRVVDPPSDARVPAWVKPVLLRGLAVDPEARHPSMDALVASLDPKPPRRARTAVIAVAIALVAIASVWIPRGGTGTCDRAGERLGGIWDAKVRSAVRAAFGKSGRAHASATFERVSRVLDGQAAEWTAMAREVCEAHEDGGDSAASSGLRQECLDARRAELGELTSHFAKADARVVDEAVHAAFELSSVSACADVEALKLAVPAAAPRERADACGAPERGRYFPLEEGRVWVYDLIDKATRRSRGDPKEVTIEGLVPMGGCRGAKRAYRVRQQSREGWAFRWQEVVPEVRDGRAGVVTQRLRDEYYDAGGHKTKDVYYVPSRIRLDETCEHTLVGATYLDSYDEVDVTPGSECDETSREPRTFEWKVVGVDVPLTLDLDYTNRACCHPGIPCRPPADGPGHSCVPAGPVGHWTCRFRTLQVDRREVSGRTAATYSFAVDVGKVLDDEKGEDREVLTCFARPP